MSSVQAEGWEFEIGRWSKSGSGLQRQQVRSRAGAGTAWVYLGAGVPIVLPGRGDEGC